MIHLPYRSHHRVSPIRSLKTAIHIVLDPVRSFLDLGDIVPQYVGVKRTLQLPPTLLMKPESIEKVGLAPSSWVTRR